MECRIGPYEGNDPRVVMIHAFDDDVIVYPLIERLNKKGLRVWHDSECRKVMVDYSGNWKKQQAECDAFIAFLSENAVTSHLFRERFTNAIESKKPLILVVTVNQDILSPGMRLQVEKAANTIKSNYIPDENLADSIAAVGILQACMGMPNPEIDVSAYPSENALLKPVRLQAVETDIDPSDRTMLELRGTLETNKPVQEIKPEKTLQESTGEKSSEKSNEKEKPNTSLEDTIILFRNDQEKSEDLDATVVPHRNELPVIISLTSGEKKKGMLGESVVGRTKKMQGALADISFTDDCHQFSGKHFLLFYIDNICILECKHPNGMNVNGQEMHEGDRYTVDSEAIIQIPSNTTLSQFQTKEVHPSYLVVASGERAKELWNIDAVALLRSKETGETRWFTEQFKFGRGNAWKTDVMVSRNISRDHGEIIFDSGRYIYRDHSANGTQINGKKINNESIELKSNDVLSVQGNDQKEESFIFCCCLVERG